MTAYQSVKKQALKAKACFFILGFLIFGTIALSALEAGTLDDLYPPLLKKGTLMHEGRFDYFMMGEDGHHSAAAYDQYNSRVNFYGLGDYFSYAPFSDLELSLGYSQKLPEAYSRTTYSTAGAVSVIQDYELNYFGNYLFGARLRSGPFEAGVGFNGNSQKSCWRSRSYPAAPNYFTYALSHYEDFIASLGYLSPGRGSEDISGFSLLTRPLRSSGQFSIDTGLRYRKGALRMNVYNFSNSTFLNYYQRLHPHFSPSVLFAIGMNEQLELEGGITRDTDYKYDYEYRDTIAAGTALVKGSYKLEDSYQAPFKARFRPREDLEVVLGSEFAFTHQRLDYYQRSAAGVVTNYPARELFYFDSRPTFGLTYFYANHKKVNDDELSRVTKRMLSSGQAMVEFSFMQDLTVLKKNSDDGTQNIIDPYDLFQYPVDFFVAGSEYSTFYTGNTSRAATGVKPQNYQLYQLSLKCGLTGKLNAGFRIGYHSSSRFDHLTLGPNAAYDLKSRSYIIKPYYFFDLLSDLKLSNNSILSFTFHYVPEYNTLLKVDGLTKEFIDRSNYYDLALSLKVLF